MAHEVIHRIPPYVLGPKVYMANQVKDKQPWGMVKHKIPDQFADTMGEGINVAVLDTGLWRHKDLPEPIFAANFSRSRSVWDSQGHSTHVAGTVGARLDGSGVVGWAPKVNLGCCKVLGDDGSGSSSAIAKGIYYAVENGAHIINMSLGGGYSPQIAQACLDAIQQGVFVICAAGNDGAQGGRNTIGYPGRLKETLAIASYRRDGRISDFSSRGPEVDMAFPGEDVLSTWPNGTFRSISGTSMACPAAAGLTALMLAYQKKHGEIFIKTNSQLREHWAKHAQDQGQPGKDTSFGWGVPDANGVVRGGTQTRPDPDPEPDPDPGTGLEGGLHLGPVHVVPHTVAGESGVFVYLDL